MNITQIEQNVLNLFTTPINPETFIYDFLPAYNQPRASITRLQKGILNLAKTAGEILWKKKLYFKPIVTVKFYDPDKMSDGLRQAHHNLDIAIEQCYRTKPFASDEERLEHLFTLYEQMTIKGTK